MHVIIDATTTQDEMAFHGIGQYTKNIVVGLLENYSDLDLTILLFENKESTLDDYLKNFSNCSVQYIGEYRSNNFWNNFYYLFQFLPNILKAKKRKSIYFCPYFWRNYPAFLMPTVLFVHDMNLPRFNMYSQKGALHNFLRKIQYWKVMQKSRFCKYILCNSQSTKNDYVKYFKNSKKVFVSHLGVNLEEREVDIGEHLPSDYAKKKYLIYLGGGINRSKNSEGVVKGYYEFLNNLKVKKGLNLRMLHILLFQEKPLLTLLKRRLRI
jgi:glycosyltransferase involved in cell wall biosynthesis